MQLSARISLVVLAFMLVPTLAQSATLTPLEELGKSLFFDKISSPGSMACADCHGPSVGFTGPNPGVNKNTAVYPGAVPQRFGNRKPPTAAYATFSPVFHFDQDEGLFIGGNFWDGRATGHTLGSPTAEQALGPFLNPVEQNMPDKKAVLEVVANSQYVEMWELVWGEPLEYMTEQQIAANYDRVGLAVGAYEGSSEVNSFSSKFDMFWANVRGAGMDVSDIVMSNWRDYDGYGLEKKELEGLALFNDESKGKCALCHTLDAAVDQYGNVLPPLLTDYSFDNLGVPRNPDNPFYGMDEVYLDDGSPINPEGDAWIDPGLGGFLMTNQDPAWHAMAAENMGKFKVPTLRNVAKAPSEEFAKAYLHNGVFTTLKKVVQFYNTRDVADWPPPEVAANVNTDELGNLGLSSKEELLIVKFMTTLSDGYIAKSETKSIVSLEFDGPNPFNPITAFSFSLDEAAAVRVQVFNAAGRRVAILHDEWTAPGSHRVPFVANGLASGVYYVQLTTRGHTATAKAVLVK